MRILLIKTSSLGDVIHNLPIASDLRARYPDAAIDWVVEEAFADVVRAHPGVRRVLPVAIRRWRGSLLAPATWFEAAAFRATVRQERYDLVLDTQGLLKSALITRMARGRRCGYAAASAREAIAARFYDAAFEVPTNLHAVERNRRLASLAAAYPLPPVPDYGIARSLAAGDETRCAVLLTATSRDDKLWPEERWIGLGLALQDRGLICLLPSGSPAERERAIRIAQAIPGAVALPSLGLDALARQMAKARLVIGVDTGLAHLAAALGRPTVALFCASDPALTGVLAATPAINLGARGQPPEIDAVLAAVGPFL